MLYRERDIEAPVISQLETAHLKSINRTSGGTPGTPPNFMFIPCWENI